MATTMQT